jgi:GNAT superfamily N-acetyltransferase
LSKDCDHGPQAPAQPIWTQDGVELWVRPLEPSDKAVLIEVFEHLGSESRYERFLAPIKHLSTEDLSYLTDIDHRDREALVAVTPAGEPVGVARYIRFGPGSGGAEVAVTVVDEWQQRGVGYALLRLLARRAREAGIATFTGICLADNRNMIQLLRELGPAVKSTNDRGGVVELEVELPTDADPDMAAAHLRAAAIAAQGIAR